MLRVLVRITNRSREAMVHMNQPWGYAPRAGDRGGSHPRGGGRGLPLPAQGGGTRRFLLV